MAGGMVELVLVDGGHSRSDRGVLVKDLGSSGRRPSHAPPPRPPAPRRSQTWRAATKSEPTANAGATTRDRHRPFTRHRRHRSPQQRQRWCRQPCERSQQVGPGRATARPCRKPTVVTLPTVAHTSPAAPQATTPRRALASRAVRCWAGCARAPPLCRRPTPQYDTAAACEGPCQCGACAGPRVRRQGPQQATTAIQGGAASRRKGCGLPASLSLSLSLSLFPNRTYACSRRTLAVREPPPIPRRSPLAVDAHAPRPLSSVEEPDGPGRVGLCVVHRG